MGPYYLGAGAGGGPAGQRNKIFQSNLIFTSVQTILDWPPWLNYVTCISHLLTTLNSSVNFYIYFLKHYRGRIFTRILPRWLRPGREGDTLCSQVGSDKL